MINHNKNQMKVHIIHKPYLFFVSDDNCDWMSYPTFDDELNRLIDQRISNDYTNFKEAGGMKPINSYNLSL